MKKNIIVEKPMCLNPNQLKKIYNLIKTKKIKNDFEFGFKSEFII